MSKLLDLAGRVTVVVGATGGLGRVLALGLASHGATIIPTGRRCKELDCVCKELDAAGHDTLRHAADVTSRSSLDALRDAVLARFGRIDVLVNGASITFREPTANIAE